MDQNEIFVTIIGMGVVTFIPRLLPLLILSSKTLPDVVIKWLRYIPVAVLSAMLLPSLVVQQNRIDLSKENIFFWVSIPTFLVAIKTKSLFTTVIAGMIMVAVCRYIW